MPTYYTDIFLIMQPSLGELGEASVKNRNLMEWVGGKKGMGKPFPHINTFFLLRLLFLHLIIDVCTGFFGACGREISS